MRILQEKADVIRFLPSVQQSRATASGDLQLPLRRLSLARSALFCSAAQWNALQTAASETNVSELRVYFL